MTAIDRRGSIAGELPMLNRNVIAATMFVLLGACGGSQDQAPTTPEPAATNPETPAAPAEETAPAEATPAPEAAPAPAPEPPKAPELSGTWSSDCNTATDAAGKPVYEKIVYTLTADHWDLARETYSDAACAKKV